MALVRDMTKAELVFQVGELPADQFMVIRYRGIEGLCQMYRFEIELASLTESVAFDQVVGQPGVLSIDTEYGPRYFHGIVGRFEVTGETVGQSYYRAELVPSLWLLTHRSNCRIFQEKTLPEILNEVLTTGGMAADTFDLEGLGREYTAREYCVQYRETDYHFLCRLMEEEGIRWYFVHDKDGYKLILEDGDSGSYTAMAGESASLPYVPPTGMVATAEHVFRFRMEQAIRPGAVVLNDFNWQNPPLDLKSTADCGRDPGLEFYDCPGEYLEQAPGGDIAKLRAEEFEAHRTVGLGRSNCPRLSVGRTFDLAQHPGGLDGTYYVTSVLHQGKQSILRTSTSSGRVGLVEPRLLQLLLAVRQSNENSTIRDLADGLLQVTSRLTMGDPTSHRALSDWLYHAGQVSRDLGTVGGAAGGNPLEALTVPNLLEDAPSTSIVDVDAPIYENRFRCIPGAVTYRPARVTPWPVMRGSQTARVVGPAGEEIHTDEYGRVRVQFAWDRVGCEGGEPMLHGADSSCWIRVSQGFAGGNYGIMFIPRVGQEVVVDFLEGNPDLPLIVGRVYNADHMPPYPLPDEKTKSVIKTRSSKGGGGSNEIRFEDLKDSEQMLFYAQKDLHVRAQAMRVETIGADRHLGVGGCKVEQVGKHKSNLKVEVKGDHSFKVLGKESVNICGTRSHDVGGDVVDKFGCNHKHEVTATYALKALSAKIEASTGIEIVCGGSSIVLTPAAIFIVAPLVNINSGSGPPVAPVTAMATSPEAPDLPAEADTVEHGEDTRYDGREEPPPAEPLGLLAGAEYERGEEEEVETTWISIELVDEADNPVPSEPYEITGPDGKTKRQGTLDANGKAYVTFQGPAGGMCQISFPRLDMVAWERANGSPPGGAGGGGVGGSPPGGGSGGGASGGGASGGGGSGGGGSGGGGSGGGGSGGGGVGGQLPGSGGSGGGGGGVGGQIPGGGGEKVVGGPGGTTGAGLPEYGTGDGSVPGGGG